MDQTGPVRAVIRRDEQPQRSQAKEPVVEHRSQTGHVHPRFRGIQFFRQLLDSTHGALKCIPISAVICAAAHLHQPLPHPVRAVWLLTALVRYAVVASRGVWRSLVARFVRDEEVVGSNPATPTALTQLRGPDR